MAGTLTHEHPAGDEHAVTVVPSRGIDDQPALDGIRGIGLLLVMMYHAEVEWAPGAFLWVSTFFTLSGYLITTLMIAEHRRTGSVGIRAFWVRRMRRLMPAAMVTLVAVVLFGAFVADAAQLDRLRGDGLAALLYVANWRFVVTETSYAALFSSPSPVQHFWTLSIEEQFYVVFPLLVSGLLWLGRGCWTRVGVSLLGVTVMSVGWMTYLYREGVPLDRLYFGTDTRLPELTSGVLLAILLSRWNPGPTSRLRRMLGGVGLAALVLVLVLTFTVHRTDAWLYQGGFAAYSVVSCLVIVGALQIGTWCRRVLSFGPARTLGTLSYSGYLFHWLVFLVVDEAVLTIGDVQLFVVRLAITVVLASLSLRFLERPVRAGERLQGRRGLAALAISIAVIVAGLLVVTDDPSAPAVDLSGEAQAVPVAVAPEARRVLVVGDSQAWVLGNALVRWAEAHPDTVAVWNLAVPGCGIVRGGEFDRLGVVATDVCEDWPPRWESALEEFSPDTVVVLSGAWDWVDRKLPEWDGWRSYGDPSFDAHVVSEYEAAADLLSSGGASIVWLTNPCYELEDFGDDPRHANETYLPPLVERFGDRLQIYDLFADLCPGGEFTDELGGFEDARPDGLHLSDDVADWTAAWLLPRLLELTDPSPSTVAAPASTEP